jgi:xylulokinase
MYTIGFDIGSSSIKGALFDVESGSPRATAQYPRQEMPIHSPRSGWAEQDPATWWEGVQEVCGRLLDGVPDAAQAVKSIGLSYQMHGLVLLDRAGAVLRPSIIWCDSRAVEIGSRAFSSLGKEYCLHHFLNSPGNFTASKLRWVQENEPEVFRAIHFVMLPGDYIAYRMTGEPTTTVPGLSEGIFWDFRTASPARRLLEEFAIDEALLPPLVQAIGRQGELTTAAAAALDLRAGIPVCYRAGDQPNNAFSLNVLEPGEAAATAGTSGVVYAVTDALNADPRSRVNLFAHVNHTPAQNRLGILLCINGTGITYAWLRRLIGPEVSYAELNAHAAEAPVGCEGLSVLPFGNGAERMLENRWPGAAVTGLDFLRHTHAHLIRAAQEGIAFSFRYGMEILREMRATTAVIRAGHANLFLSPLFRETLANVTGAAIEMYETDGATGAARGAALGLGVYSDVREAFRSLRRIGTVEPRQELSQATEEAYRRWSARLAHLLEAEASR